MEAQSLVDLMVRVGVKPDVISYNIILNGLCKNDFVDDAFKMFRSLCSMDFQLDIVTFNIMIGALLKSGRKEDAMDMFTAISAHGLVPNVVTCQLVAENLINDGLLDEFENLFLTMEKSGCTPNSRMLNVIVRRLLHRGEIMRAKAYLSKIDEKNFSLEASTTSLLLSVFSREEYRHHAKSLPEKYHFLEEISR
jgi:leucine-rich PPR motif-containing protein